MSSNGSSHHHCFASAPVMNTLTIAVVAVSRTVPVLGTCMVLSEQPG